MYAEDGIFKLRFGNKFIVCVFKPNLVKVNRLMFFELLFTFLFLLF